jgi:hypothetical protein
MIKYLNIFNLENETTKLSRNVGHQTSEWRGVTFHKEKDILEILVSLTNR